MFSAIYIRFFFFGEWRKIPVKLQFFSGLFLINFNQSPYEPFKASACHQLHAGVKCQTLIKSTPKCQNAFFWPRSRVESAKVCLDKVAQLLASSVALSAAVRHAYSTHPHSLMKHSPWEQGRAFVTDSRQQNVSQQSDNRFSTVGVHKR